MYYNNLKMNAFTLVGDIFLDRLSAKLLLSFRFNRVDMYYLLMFNYPANLLKSVCNVELGATYKIQKSYAFKLIHLKGLCYSSNRLRKQKNNKRLRYKQNPFIW